MAAPTEDQQWQEINYPSFFGAIGDRVTAAKMAMDAIPVEPGDSTDWLETNVNQVPIWWRNEGQDCFLRVGMKANGEPFYEIKIPYQWLAA
jgi:hypothetical protein